jgi:hypothetical protein
LAAGYSRGGIGSKLTRLRVEGLIENVEVGVWRKKA